MAFCEHDYIWHTIAPFHLQRYIKSPDHFPTAGTTSALDKIVMACGTLMQACLPLGIQLPRPLTHWQSKSSSFVEYSCTQNNSKCFTERNVSKFGYIKLHLEASKKSTKQSRYMFKQNLQVNSKVMVLLSFLSSSNVCKQICASFLYASSACSGQTQCLFNRWNMNATLHWRSQWEAEHKYTPLSFGMIQSTAIISVTRTVQVLYL